MENKELSEKQIAFLRTLYRKISSALRAQARKANAKALEQMAQDLVFVSAVGKAKTFSAAQAEEIKAIAKRCR